MGAGGKRFRVVAARVVRRNRRRGRRRVGGGGGVRADVLGGLGGWEGAIWRSGGVKAEC